MVAIVKLYHAASPTSGYPYYSLSHLLDKHKICAIIPAHETRRHTPSLWSLLIPMTEFDPETIKYVETYLRTWSKSKAYKAISPDVTQGSAYHLGLEYFKKVQVQELLKLRLEELKAGPEEVVATITNIHRHSK